MSESATRTGWQYPDRIYDRGEWGEWPSRRQHSFCDMDKIMRLDSYQPGDYKRFLCDAHTKGAYLKWAPWLLNAEKYYKMTDEEKAAI